MKVQELLDALDGIPPTADVTVAVTPERHLPVTGTEITMERDSGELCQPGEVTLLAVDVFTFDDLDVATWRSPS